MKKTLSFAALSLATALCLALPARAEIVDYGYGSSYYGYGTTSYGTSYGSYGTLARDLTIGSYGADVQALESFLAARGYLTVPGSGYFSAATRDAVVRFQLANGISPTGYCGPLTRSLINAQQGGAYGYNQYPYGGTYPNYGYGYASCPSGSYPSSYYGGQVSCVFTHDSNNDDDDDDLDGGHATLRNFSIDDGDDTDLEEGDDDAELAQISFEPRGGDVELDSVEVRFEQVEGDEDPWDVFDRVRLVGDGDELQEIDASDDDEWHRDGDGWILRFDDPDRYVVDEDDEADLTLEADIANVIVFDDDVSSWDISVPDDGLKARDGDGERDEIGDDGNTVRVEVQED